MKLEIKQLKTLLIIGTNWPEPQTTAAGGRMQRLIHFFLQQGYQITFASTASESDLAMDLESLGIQKRNIVLNHSSFDDFIIRLQPEVVLFDRFPIEEQFGWRVAESTPKAIRILDTEDLHSLRKTREFALKKKIAWDSDYWLQADITKREIASIYRSDLSLIISSFEMKLLQDILKIDSDLLLHLPFMLDGITDAESKKWPDFDERTDFICIGNGKHAPNVDAIVWLKKIIWPLIRKALPEVNLHVYGAYLPEQLKQMHNGKEGFLVHGWATKKELVFQKARVNLAPLRFGAGLKGKLIDGMQAGTPNVTTTIGAEGMYTNLKWSGTIANHKEDFAKAAIALYQNETLWKKAQQNGILIVNTDHSKVTAFNQFETKLQFIKQHLKAHRLKNFIGTLLQQQTTASTKYMSKWIEEKGKNT